MKWYQKTSLFHLPVKLLQSQYLSLEKVISSVLAGQNWAPLLVHLLQPQKDTEQKEKKCPFQVQQCKHLLGCYRIWMATCTFHLSHFSLLTEVPDAKDFILPQEGELSLKSNLAKPTASIYLYFYLFENVCWTIQLRVQSFFWSHLLFPELSQGWWNFILFQ